jgi:hypothetical protein
MDRTIIVAGIQVLLCAFRGFHGGISTVTFDHRLGRVPNVPI